MRVRDFLKVLMSDLLTVIVCVLYTVFLVGLIEEVVDLGGGVYWVVLSVVFTSLLFLNFRYYSPSLIAISLGRPVDVERQSVGAVYIGVFIGSLLVAAIIFQEVGKVFCLEGLFSFVVSLVIFIMVFVSLGLYVRRLRRKD